MSKWTTVRQNIWLVIAVLVFPWETTLPYRGKLHITQASGYAEDKNKIITIKRSNPAKVFLFIASKFVTIISWSKKITDLQHGGHEYWAAHEDEYHEAGEALLSDAQELGLFTGCGAFGLQFQAVHVADWQHRRSHEPREAHERAHAQHHTHHKQVQMIPTAFLWMHTYTTKDISAREQDSLLTRKEHIVK